jgi:hypothetical protein
MDGRTRPDLIGLAVTLIIYVVRLLSLPFSSCVHLDSSHCHFLTWEVRSGVLYVKEYSCV